MIKKKPVTKKKPVKRLHAKRRPWPRPDPTPAQVKRAVKAGLKRLLHVREELGETSIPVAGIRDLLSIDEMAIEDAYNRPVDTRLVLEKAGDIVSQLSEISLMVPTASTSEVISILQDARCAVYRSSWNQGKKRR